MQAITTKYLPATNFRPSRIKASCPAGSVTLPYDYDEIDGGHYQAVTALIKKLGWHDYGTWYAGDMENGKVYVCSPKYASSAVNIV
jgi:hypothetical protein